MKICVDCVLNNEDTDKCLVGSTLDVDGTCASFDPGGDDKVSKQLTKMIKPKTNEQSGKVMKLTPPLETPSLLSQIKKVQDEALKSSMGSAPKPATEEPARPKAVQALAEHISDHEACLLTIKALMTGADKTVIYRDGMKITIEQDKGE